MKDLNLNNVNTKIPDEVWKTILFQVPYFPAFVITSSVNHLWNQFFKDFSPILAQKAIQLYFPRLIDVHFDSNYMTAPLKLFSEQYQLYKAMCSEYETSMPAILSALSGDQQQILLEKDHTVRKVLFALFISNGHHSEKFAILNEDIETLKMAHQFATASNNLPVVEEINSQIALIESKIFQTARDEGINSFMNSFGKEQANFFINKELENDLFQKARDEGLLSFIKSFGKQKAMELNNNEGDKIKICLSQEKKNKIATKI